MLPVVFMKIYGRYLNSAKWLIFRDFNADSSPFDLQGVYNVKDATLQKYFREWKAKRWGLFILWKQSVTAGKNRVECILSPRGTSRIQVHQPGYVPYVLRGFCHSPRTLLLVSGFSGILPGTLSNIPCNAISFIVWCNGIISP